MAAAQGNTQGNAQGNAQAGQGQGQQNANRGRGQGRGRIARAHGRGRGGRAYAANAEPTLANEENERAMLHAAIDNRGAQNQYAVIQTPANYQGTLFELLIDCGSTHSFLSPKCLRKPRGGHYV